MVKNCRVLVNNEAVTVIEYEGKQVQIPSIHRDANTVNVIVKNGRHIVIDDDYKEEIPQETSDISTEIAEENYGNSKKKNKKTTFYEDMQEVYDYVDKPTNETE